MGNLACVSLALHRCQSMGLLPAHSGDWLDFPENPERVEYASGGFNFQSATFEIATPTKPGY